MTDEDFESMRRDITTDVSTINEDVRAIPCHHGLTGLGQQAQACSLCLLQLGHIPLADMPWHPCLYLPLSEGSNHQSLKRLHDA